MGEYAIRLGIVLGLFGLMLAVGRHAHGVVGSERVWVEEEPRVFPTVDSHVHMQASEDAYEIGVKAMDASGIAVTVCLSGATGETLAEHLELAGRYPGRFVVFAGLDQRGADWDAEDIGEKFAASIQESFDMGAAGIGEIGKWGLRERIAWDDERLDPMWAKLEELQFPINWHVSEPSRHWRPESPVNTLEYVCRHRMGPLKQDLLNQQEHVLERHPNLVVIACHSNWLADSIPLLAYRFEKYPNYYIDVSASLGEWGRVPEEFVDVCKEYGDRILYGTDAGYRGVTDEPDFEEKFIEAQKGFHMAHRLFLGTRQRMIPVPFDGNYGRYPVSRKGGLILYAHDGVELPDDVLEKIYYRNAERLFKIDVSAVAMPGGGGE